LSDLPTYCVRCVGSFLFGTAAEVVARMESCANILRALHEAGMDLSRKDDAGKCALAVELERIASMDDATRIAEAFQLTLVERLVSLAPETCLSLDADGVTPLAIACACGLTSIVPSMLAAVKLASVSRIAPSKDTFALTPIEAAVANGRLDVLRMLLEAGPAMATGDGLLTPLHVAAAFGRTEAVALLLSVTLPIPTSPSSACELLAGTLSKHKKSSTVITVLRKQRLVSKRPGRRRAAVAAVAGLPISLFSPLTAALVGATCDMSKHSTWYVCCARAWGVLCDEFGSRGLISCLGCRPDENRKRYASVCAAVLKSAMSVNATADAVLGATDWRGDCTLVLACRLSFWNVRFQRPAVVVCPLFTSCALLHAAYASHAEAMAIFACKHCGSSWVGATALRVQREGRELGGGNGRRNCCREGPDTSGVRVCVCVSMRHEARLCSWCVCAWLRMQT
jgi:hypothetical protein